MKSVVTGLSVLFFVFASTPGQARPASIVGHWSGGGSIVSASGGREHTRCRASVRPKGARRFRVIARCALASLGVIDQKATVRRIGKNRYRGRFRNDQYNIVGWMTILVRGNRQFVSLSSSSGRGNLVMRRR